MNLFGIALTPGHLILMAVGIVVYDAIWTWIFSNETSEWWFERLQGFLKMGIYMGIIALVVLIVYTPWPYNLILAISTVLTVVFVVVWIWRRNA